MALRCAASTPSVSARRNRAFSTSRSVEGRGLEPDEAGSALPERLRLVLLDHAEVVAARRVQDAVVAEPERDVVDTAPGVAVEDEVAGLRVVDGLAGLCLLPRVPRHDPARAPVRHVDEP